jgi:hypothetical protein
VAEGHGVMEGGPPAAGAMLHVHVSVQQQPHDGSLNTRNTSLSKCRAKYKNKYTPGMERRRGGSLQIATTPKTKVRGIVFYFYFILIANLKVVDDVY